MARAIDRRLWVLRRLSDASASFDASGLEVVQVAAASCLRAGSDWVLPHHRDLALCLALGLSPLDVMLGMLGRAAERGSGGRQSPGAFGLRSARIVTASNLAGSHVVHAAGIAYASKLRGLEEVTLVGCGARDIESGDWHEGLNFAAVHRLPLVCLVQDKVNAVQETPRERLSDRVIRKADGYGVAGEALDGRDFDVCAVTLERAVSRARGGGGPTLIHATVPQLTSAGVRGTRLGQDQLEASSRDDPIERMRRRLHEGRVLDDDTDSQVQRDCVNVVLGALNEAMTSSPPPAPAALDNVFARN